MTNTFNLKQWAEKTTIEKAEQIKSLIDCGMDYEDAVDLTFENSVLGKSYKMQALELVGNYHHTHRFVFDVITEKNWCATCQKFQ